MALNWFKKKQKDESLDNGSTEVDEVEAVEEESEESAGVDSDAVEDDIHQTWLCTLL